ncbi:organic cation transporter protein-like [Panulirus ornatus]|uniref:organic cation transporter protein-like n=1 Tax=Panulirus ornatus TaxID=150431 RepID=UPI003A889961
MSYQFLGATPDYWCHVAPLVEANWTQEQILSLAIPYRNATREYDGCHMHDYNYTAAVELGYATSVSNVSALGGGNGALVKCSSRTFNYTQYTSTIVTEWDLVCERRVLYSTTQAVAHVGGLLGSLGFGYFIDRYGRRPVLLVCSMIKTAASFMIPVSPTVEVYIILKGILTCMASGQYLTLFVFAMETCAVKYRAAVGTLLVLPWALGYMLVPGIAYLVRQWKWLQFTYSIPGLSAIVYFWWFPESPRWLIVHGRNQEALKVMTWSAKINRNTLPPDHVLLASMKKMERQGSLKKGEMASSGGNNFLSLVFSKLKHIIILCIIPQLRARTLVSMFCWLSAGMVYYGVSLNATNLSTDPYLYIFLGGLLEVPTYLLLWLALMFIGRKKSLVALYLVCGFFVILVMALMLLYAADAEGVRVFLSLVGKVAVTAAYQVIWMYTAELYPTEYRSLAVGEGNSWSRMGSTFSSFINDILGEHFIWAPSALFGLMSLVSAALTLLLPETRHCEMPESNDFI